MVVRLRLARHGQRHTPLYHIVAINAAKRRDARPIEKLGEYDPIPRIPASYGPMPPSANVFGPEKHIVQKEKRVEWNVDRINYWLSVGAQPTRSVVKLLERGGVLTTPHKWQHPWSPPPADPAAESSPTETSAVETSALETSAVDANSVETSAVETSAVETSAVADKPAASA